MAGDAPTRRRFLAALPALLLSVGAAPLSFDRAAHGCHAGAMRPRAHGARRAGGPWPHPDPRPGIDGSRVLRAGQLADHPEAIPVFDMVRGMPQVADGIKCHCTCADDPAYRSLLSCYEGTGMARDCAICQGQARLAHRLHGEGKSLAEIRAAIDADFG